MKTWQHQLGNIGKVHQVTLPAHLSELGHGTTPEACARYILVSTCSKVQEVRREGGGGGGRGEREGGGGEARRKGEREGGVMRLEGEVG